MPPVNPVELLAVLLLGISLVLVPAALAFALMSLARSDRRPAPVLARRSPRKVAAPPRRFGRQGRRFPGR